MTDRLRPPQINEPGYTPPSEIVLFPPKLKVLKNDKYNLQVEVKWGEHSRLLEIDKERYSMGAIIDLISDTLLDLSEKKPYDIIK